MKYHNVACSEKDDEADSSAGKKISLKNKGKITTVEWGQDNAPSKSQRPHKT